jgi:hypothetical protein
MICSHTTKPVYGIIQMKHAASGTSQIQTHKQENKLAMPKQEGNTLANIQNFLPVYLESEPQCMA